MVSERAADGGRGRGSGCDLPVTMMVAVPDRLSRGRTHEEVDSPTQTSYSSEECWAATRSMHEDKRQPGGRRGPVRMAQWRKQE